MDNLKRLLREYNLISAAVIGTLGFATLMEIVVLTETQMAGALGLISVWMLVLRFLVTPVASAVLPKGTEVNANDPDRPTTVIE